MGYNRAKKIMKKVLHLTLIAALVILIGFPSCTKSPEQQIVGKWKITRCKVDGSQDEDAKGEVWTFKENGKFSGYLDEDFNDCECNWYIDGSELILKGGDLDNGGSGWSEEFVYTLDIEQLDNSNLVVSGKVKYECNMYGDHRVETWKVSYDLEAK